MYSDKRSMGCKDLSRTVSKMFFSCFLVACYLDTTRAQQSHDSVVVDVQALFTGSESVFDQAQASWENDGLLLESERKARVLGWWRLFDRPTKLQKTGQKLAGLSDGVHIYMQIQKPPQENTSTVIRDITKHIPFGQLTMYFRNGEIWKTHPDPKAEDENERTPVILFAPNSSATFLLELQQTANSLPKTSRAFRLRLLKDDRPVGKDAPIWKLVDWEGKGEILLTRVDTSRLSDVKEKAIEYYLFEKMPADFSLEKLPLESSQE